MGDGFDKLADQLSSMMDDMMSKSAFQISCTDSWEPNVNVYELADRVLVCVDLAGMRCEEIDIRSSGTTLRVTGSRAKPPLPVSADEVNVHQLEIDSGRFDRTIRLPVRVDVDAVSASYKQGYVWIVLPRSGGSDDQ